MIQAQAVLTPADHMPHPPEEATPPERPSATRLWAMLRREAEAAGRRDALVAGLLERAVFAHDGLGAALAWRIGSKLGDDSLDAATTTTLVAEALEAQPALLEACVADLTAILDRDPACPDHLTPFLFFKGFLALQAFRITHRLWRQGRAHLAHQLQSRMSEVLGVDIHPAARLGQGIMLDHATGLVIGETAVVEDDVSILQEVTLGGTGKNCGDRHPKIRRGVLIGAGAKILGAIEVGEGAKVGAGSIVLADVAPYTTVVGVPARPVGTRLEGLPALTMDQTLPTVDYSI